MDQYQRSQIDHLLFQVLRTIFHYERSIVKSYGLNFEQIYVLQFLRRHPDARLTEIALEMDLPKFTTSRLLNRLIKEGFITKKQDPVDRRNYHIRLEEKGKKVIVAIETASYTRISANIQGFSPAAINELVDVAEQLHLVLGVTEKIKTNDEISSSE
jgi:DNA-binding MarR family transcriptional regulator